MEKLFLGFDAGTQSVKVSVYDASWKCRATYAKPTTLHTPKPDRVEMDPDEYVALTVEGIAACVREIRAKGLDPAQIQAVMGDGIICGICGVDAEGNAVTPYVNYLDSRTQEDCERINALNLPIWAAETGNPEALCLFPAMFARWFLANSPEFVEKGVKFMHNAPYILAHLAGLKGADAFIDWGTLSGWGLGYKVEEKCWSPEQLKILGIDERYMPRIVKPWDTIGTIGPEMARQTGLKEGTLVCAGAGDTMQSMLGSGVFSADKGVDVAGTCSMFCVSTQGIVPELSKKGTGLIFNSGTLKDTYFYWGYIRTGGLALRWFKDNICRKEGDSSYYRELSEGAANVKPGCNGVVFLPYLTGGSGPNAKLSGCFLNMTLKDDIFVAWRAVLEAIGYDYMEITDTYRKAGVALDTVTVTEGGSRDELWNQIKADMLASRVVRFRNAGGAVVTNCVFAALASGAIDEPIESLKRTIQLNATYLPDEENTRLYRRLYDLKTRLVKTDMEKAFDTLVQMREE